MISIGVISGLTAMIGWGIGDFLQSKITKDLGAIKYMYLTSIFSLLLPLPLLFFGLLKGIIQISVINTLLILVSSALFSVGAYFFLRSFQLGEVAIVAPVAASYSLITVILSLLVLGKSLSLLKIISIGIIVLGLMLATTDLRKLKHVHTVAGVREALLAMLFWGIYFVLLDYISESMDVFNLGIFTWYVPGLFMIGIALFRGGYIKLSKVRGNHLLVVFITNIIFIISWVAISIGIEQGLVSIVTPISSLSPAVTVLLAGIFYKEKLVMNQKIGIFTILLGLFLISI